MIQEMQDFPEPQERREKMARTELTVNQEFQERMVLPELKVHGDHEVLLEDKDPQDHRD